MEEDRKKLAENRQALNEERELKFQLNSNLEMEYKKYRVKNIQEKFENKYEVAAIIFFFTLIWLYCLIFGFKFILMTLFGGLLEIHGTNLSWINLPLHVMIWTASLWSVFRRKSVLDDLRDLFF